ncbi:MAG: YdcF family protein [Chryseolinea sp.]
MFFILSKTLNFLAMPFTVVCLTVLFAWLVKNPKLKQKLLILALTMLIFFSNDFISNEIMQAWEIDTQSYSSLSPHELGIVLTGTTMPLLKPDDRIYFARGADRVTHTVQLYKLGLIKKILISGGSGRLIEEDEPEANKFQKAMVLMGVPENDIILENATRNTYESAIAVKPMLDSLNYVPNDCLLITSAFHMRRSLACYRKAGLNIEPFTTDFYAHPTNFYPDSLLEPKLDAMLIWHKLAKEWMGFIAYKVAGYI